MKRFLCKIGTLVLCTFVFSLGPAVLASPLLDGCDTAEAAGGLLPGEPWDGVTTADPIRDGPAPFKIETAAQLAGMRDWINVGFNLDREYRLLADIDLGGHQWTPIGLGEFGDDGSGSPTFASGDATPFEGRFYGDGHTVGNFVIVSADYGLDVAGLFGVVSGDGYTAEIRSLDVADFVISVDRNADNGRTGTSFALDSYVIAAGGLAGVMQNALIADCRAWGRIAAWAHDDHADPDDVSMSAAYAGGICGFVTGGGLSRFQGCFADVDAETSSTAVDGGAGTIDRMQMSLSGGQIGFVYGASVGMDNCHAAGDVNAAAATVGYYAQYRDLILSLQAGGLVGAFSYESEHNEIRSSGASGAVSADITAGGLVGHAVLSLDIESCRASGAVTANEYAGGLVGQSEGGSSVRSSAASGTVATNDTFFLTGAGGYAGGLVAYLYDGTVERSNAVGDVSAAGSLGRAGGLVGEGQNTAIRWSYASGGVSTSPGGQFTGGISGLMSGDSEMRCSYATGPVRAGNLVGVNPGMAGGLVGVFFGTYTGATSIDMCYATGDVHVGRDGLVGGLAGWIGNRGHAGNPDSLVHLATGYAYGNVTGDGGARVGGVLGHKYLGSQVLSADWLQTGSVNATLSAGVASEDVSTPLLDARSMDNMDVSQVARFWDDQGWAFNLVQPEDDKWGYTALDNKEKPVLGAFFGTDWNTLHPDMICLLPDVLAIRPGEAKLVRLAAGGYEKSVSALTPLQNLSSRGITVRQHAVSKDVLVVTAAPNAARAELAVSVDVAINGYAQPQQALRLMVGPLEKSDPGPGPGPGPEDPSKRPHYRSADIRALSVNVGDTVYAGTLQADGETWTVTVPYDTDPADLEKVTPSISLWPGATYTPRPPYDLRQPVQITVTALDGATKKTYTLTVERERPPAVAADILNKLPANWAAVWTENADGSWSLVLTIPFDQSFDGAAIDKIAVLAEGLAGIRVYYVNASGEVQEIERYQAGGSRAGVGDKLRIEGTAADRASAEKAKVVKVTVYKKNDSATYYQDLNVSLVQVPGGKLPAEPETPESGGGSSGCDTGVGLASMLFGFAGLSALVSLGGKRQR